jgi:hypothetical protein
MWLDKSEGIYWLMMFGGIDEEEVNYRLSLFSFYIQLYCRLGGDRS